MLITAEKPELLRRYGLYMNQYQVFVIHRTERFINDIRLLP